MKILTLIITLLLSACGMTGDLYLPDESRESRDEEKQLLIPEKSYT